MGRALILIESLAAALLLVAPAAAWASRRKTGPGRWGLPVAVVLVVGVSIALTDYGLWFLNRSGTVSTSSHPGSDGASTGTAAMSFLLKDKGLTHMRSCALMRH